jgi:hypothetical protein
MRPSVLALMLMPVLAGCCYSEPSVPAASPAEKRDPPLAAYVNADLRKLKEGLKADLTKALAGILPEKYGPDAPFPFKPWFVWRNPAAREKNEFIVFQGRPIFMIPGTSSAAVHFIDASGKLLNSVAFSTGWRIDLESAQMVHEPLVKGDVIEVRSSPVINGNDIVRQVYGVIGRRVALLRLEDSHGKLIANFYHAPNHTIGPDVPKRSTAEWEQALASTKLMIVLEALAWLGGHHRDDLSPTDVYIEDLETAKLVAAVRQRPGVRKRLDRLTRSENTWLQQAAKMALEQLQKSLEQLPK